MKSIDYFSYGLPLINNIKGDTWEIVNDKGYGINIHKDNIDCYDFFSDIDHKEIIAYYKKTYWRIQSKVMILGRN